MAETTAGRALDAEIEIRIFGATWDESEGRRYLMSGSRVLAIVVAGGSTFICDGALPAYSTDIADAWLIVEKLTDRFHAVLQTPFMAGNAYVAGFTPLGVTGWNGAPDFVGVAETMPLAICIAALEAVAAPPTAEKA